MTKTSISKHPIAFLNLTQFMGSLNDNIFKYLIVFLLINLLGAGESSEILFWVGVVYVAPFLLFSSNAGVLADRFSKQRLLIALKVLEVVIMALGIVAFAYKSQAGLYTLMFLLSLQSALFSPPKYSIIPELVSKGLISKANGIVTSATYLAIIIGTFLASFITQITNKNFVFAGIVCLGIAIIGWGTSLFIPYVPAKDTDRKISPLFIRSIFHTLGQCKSVPFLLIAISGSAFFLFIGAFLQLNIIPFAINSLGLSEIGGGYLFLLCAIGIACGAQLAGRISKHQVEIGLSCLAGIGIIITLLILYFARHSIPSVMTSLFFLGFISGFFIIPFDSFVQTYSAHHHRGQVIAANNFLSFCGVLLAPIFLYIISGFLNLSAAFGFIVMAFATTGFTCFLWLRGSCYLFNFISVRILVPIMKLKVANPCSHAQTDSWPALISLVAISPNFKICYYSSKNKRNWMQHIHYCSHLPKQKKGTLLIAWRWPKKLD